MFNIKTIVLIISLFAVITNFNSTELNDKTYNDLLLKRQSFLAKSLWQDLLNNENEINNYLVKTQKVFSDKLNNELLYNYYYMAYSNIGIANYNDAKKFLDKGLELFEKNFNLNLLKIDYFLKYALIFLKNNNKIEAKKYLLSAEELIKNEKNVLDRQIIELDMNLAGIIHFENKINEASDRMENAKKLLFKAVYETDDSLGNYSYILFNYYIFIKKVDLAISLLNEYINKNNKNELEYNNVLNFYYILSCIYKEQNNIIEEKNALINAEALIEKIAKFDTRELPGVIAYNLGIVYENEKNIKSAIEYYKKAYDRYQKLYDEIFPTELIKNQNYVLTIAQYKDDCGRKIIHLTEKK